MKKLSRFRLSNHDQTFSDYDEALAVAATLIESRREPVLMMGYRRSGRLAEWQVICTGRTFDKQSSALALVFEDRPSKLDKP